MIRILIPFYNEEANLNSCLKGISIALKNKPYRIYAVNDGSTDGTLSVLRRLSKKYRLTIINHSTNLGVAEALKTGFQMLQTHLKSQDVLVVMEGDNTSDPGLLIPLVKKVLQGNDIVIASRYRFGGGYHNFPLQRELLSRTANFLFKSLFHYPGASDYTVFYRSYSPKIINKVRLTFGSNLIRSKYFTANSEILVKMLKLHPRLTEVAFNYDYSQKKGTSGLVIGKNLWEYWKFIWGMLLV